MTTPEKSVRWWPLIAILLLSLAATVYVWTTGSVSGRQERVMNTGLVVVVTTLLALLWLLVLSRLRWRVRLVGFALVVLALVGLGSLLEIRGVTGDLVPIVGWRWGPSSDRLEPAAGAGRALSGRPESPQFLGPGRNGVIAGTALDPDWAAHPPVELWRRTIGAGFSSFAVVGDLAITQEQRGEEELVVAYARDTGAVVWVFADEARYSTAIAGTGPRGTPTVDGGRVFALGATGRLHALDLATGASIWTHDLITEHGGRLPDWGAAGSPLVVDGRVVVNAGGPGASLVAYGADRGELLWQAGDESMSYSAPTVVELAGVRQIVHFHPASVAGHRIEDGAVLWSHPWSNAQPNVALPVPLPGERLLISSGYGIGAEAIRLASADGGLEVDLDWKSTRLKAKFANPIVYDGSVYGLDDGVLVCLDPETGERRWKHGRYGHGQVLLVGDLLLIQAEDGEVVLVEANPVEHVELARLPALDGRTWNPPVLAGDQLFLRNDREAVAYRLHVDG